MPQANDTAARRKRVVKVGGVPLKVVTRNGLPSLPPELAVRFPDVECPVRPYDNRVVVQLRLPSTHAGSGLILKAAETREIDRWHEQIGRVVAIGPRAFHSLDTGQPWPEGPWYSLGDIVHVPRHASYKVKVQHPTERGEIIVFATLREIDVVGLVVGSPLDIEFQS